MIKQNYHFHFRCSDFPLVVSELSWNSHNNYGQFEYVILQERDLITAYCSDIGVKDQYNFGKDNLFGVKEIEKIFQRIKNLDDKIINFDFNVDEKKEGVEISKEEWKSFYNQFRVIAINFGEVYFIMESMTLAPLAEFVEKICEREGLSQDQLLHNISLAKNLSEEEKRLVGFLNRLGNEKLLLHKHIEPVFITLFKFYNFIAKDKGISSDKILMMTDQEINKFFETGEVNSQVLEDRSHGVVIITGRKDSVFKIYSGEEYEKWKKFLKPDFNGDIKGTIACRGKIIGKVSLHLGWINAIKVPAGNVLVAGMTNPQMVPFIKNVAAIVTDEGGLTCHAAIISREMKIPCIVGAKVATQVLKDGDLVEVDANKGIVKIIKRAGS